MSGAKKKNVLKNKDKLFEEKQNFIFFAWGQTRL